MKIAVVHEWIAGYAGSEKVLEQILKTYPESDLFCIADCMPADASREFLQGKKLHTSFAQRLPGIKRHYRNYLPLLPMAAESIDVSGYDLVISNSHAVAKGVLTTPQQLHISYVHTPMRYAWDLQEQYMKTLSLPKRVAARAILHYIRLWDQRTASNVDHFVCNSKYIAQRIWKTYRRDATVIYPPVEIRPEMYSELKEDFYVTASRMVPYKMMPLIVEAFNQMPSRRLVVIGDGPDYNRIVSIAKSNVQVLGYQSTDVLLDHLRRARAFVFAAEEDFGITPVEANACGTPVIAYGRGGALETVVGLDADAPTGVFFEEQNAASIIAAVERFEAHRPSISPQDCLRNAERFGIERFRREFREFVDLHVAAKLSKKGRPVPDSEQHI